MTDVRIDPSGPLANYYRNVPYVMDAKRKSYSTPLDSNELANFAKWQKQNNVPYDPSPTSDYDMTGFYKALMAGDPRATIAVNQNDNQLHYPDYWKTPYHKTFSNESQWANKSTAPSWNDKDQLILPSGDVVYDERAANR